MIRTTYTMSFAFSFCLERKIAYRGAGQVKHTCVTVFLKWQWCYVKCSVQRSLVASCHISWSSSMFLQESLHLSMTSSNSHMHYINKTRWCQSIDPHWSVFAAMSHLYARGAKLSSTLQRLFYLGGLACDVRLRYSVTLYLRRMLAWFGCIMALNMFIVTMYTSVVPLISFPNWV